MEKLQALTLYYELLYALNAWTTAMSYLRSMARIVELAVSRKKPVVV